MFRMRQRHDGNEAGWISMCDLLLLLFAVGLLFAGTLARATQVATKARVDGQAQLGIAQDLLNQTRKALEQYQIASKDNLEEWSNWQEFVALHGCSPQDAIAKQQGLVDQAARDADAAKTAQEEFERKLREKGSALEAEIKRAKELEGERTDLKQRLTQFDVQKARIAALEEQLASLSGGEKELASLREKAVALAAERDDFEKKAQQLKQDLDDASKKLIAALAEAKGSTAAVATLTGTVTALENDVRSQGNVRQELLGLPGSLGNVIFIVDRSESMDDGGRWDDAKKTVESWIKHLPVERAALIVFNGDALVIPELSDPSSATKNAEWEIPLCTEESRVSMISELHRLEPQGLTLTQRAMKKAMQFRDPDSIILLTDGIPEQSAGAVLDPVSEVFGLVEAWRTKHPDSHVHTVGIGDYFSKRSRDFLLGVAERGAGAFIGR